MPITNIVVVIMRKAQRQLILSITMLYKGTAVDPKLWPNHMIPIALPLFFCHQLATAVVKGLANPRLDPKIRPKRNGTIKIAKLSQKLMKRHPRAMVGTPISIIVLGPNLSTKYPSIGPRKAVSILAIDRPAAITVRLTPKEFESGIKNAGNAWNVIPVFIALPRTPPRTIHQP